MQLFTALSLCAGAQASCTEATAAGVLSALLCCLMAYGQMYLHFLPAASKAQRGGIFNSEPRELPAGCQTDFLHIRRSRKCLFTFLVQVICALAAEPSWQLQGGEVQKKCLPAPPGGSTRCSSSQLRLLVRIVHLSLSFFLGCLLALSPRTARTQPTWRRERFIG